MTTRQQGKTNVAWAIRVKTGMRNAELDKVTAEEFMLSWVVAATTDNTFHANLCREKKLTWELFEEIAASSDMEKMQVEPGSTTSAVNAEDTAAVGKP